MGLGFKYYCFIFIKIVLTIGKIYERNMRFRHGKSFKIFKMYL